MAGYNLLSAKRERFLDDTLTTDPFTPEPNSLLLVVATSICPNGYNGGSSISDTVGLTWEPVVLSNSGGTGGDWPTMIFGYIAPVGAAEEMTITHVYGANGASGFGVQDITVIGITGHDPVNPVRQTFHDEAQSAVTHSTTATVYEGALDMPSLADSLLFGFAVVDEQAPASYDLWQSYEHVPVWDLINRHYDGSDTYSMSLSEVTTGTSTDLMRIYMKATYSWNTFAIEIRAAGAEPPSVGGTGTVNSSSSIAGSGRKRARGSGSASAASSVAANGHKRAHRNASLTALHGLAGIGRKRARQSGSVGLLGLLSSAGHKRALGTAAIVQAVSMTGGKAAPVAYSAFDIELDAILSPDVALTGQVH